MQFLMKRKYLFGLLTFLFAVFIYSLLVIVPKEREARENVENSKKIMIGMSLRQVVKIMGEPDNKANENEGMTYYYKPPAFSSDGIFISFDAEETVQKVVYYD